MQTHRAYEMFEKWWVIVAYRHTRPTLQNIFCAKRTNRDSVFCRVGQIASAMQTHRAHEMSEKWWVIVAYRHTRPTLQRHLLREENKPRQRFL